MPQLVDPSGRPIAPRSRLRAEDVEVLLGLRRKRFAPVIAAGLTPERLVAIFHDVERGKLDVFLTLAKELEKHDPHYRSVLGVRKLSVLKRNTIVEPASDDTRDVFVAEEFEKITKSPEWLWMSLHCLDGLGKGYACTELVWDFSEGQAMPRFKKRDPRDFTLDPDTLTRVVRKIPSTGLTEELPYGKYVVHNPGLIFGSPVDSALAITEAILYLYGSLALHDLGDFLERFGTPTLLGQYVNEGQRQELLDGLAALSRAGYGALPPGAKVEALDGARMGGGEKLHDMVIRLLDEQKSKLVLGQTMTSDNGSSRSQAEVHDEVKDDITDFDCWALSTTQQQYVADVWRQLNYGDSVATPKLSRPGDDEGDVAAIANVLFGMADRGARIPVKHLLDLLGAPEAGDDEDVLEPISTGKGDLPGSPSRLSVAQAQPSSPDDDDDAAAAE